jgi:hypothetical protein
MKITRDNYEPFFLDFLEGNLEENQIDQFLDFLEQNPDLKEELQLFENVRLPEEHIPFPERKQLYRNRADEISEHQNQVIAYLEGDLETDEQKSFEIYLSSHPELKKEYDLFAKTRLIPDAGVKYSEKRKLYRKTGTILIMNWVARTAAVLVLIWGINSVIQLQNGLETRKANPQLAEISPKPTPPVKKMESEKKPQDIDVLEKMKPAKESKPSKPQSIREQTKGRLEEKRPAVPKATERELTSLTEISPIFAQLDTELQENQLAVSRVVNVQKINDSRNIMTLDEFLASRAKKVGNEGLLSAQRIARVGLGLAAELSGDRIGYSMKDGKINSVGFESKLMAFSIPLTKK